MSEKQITLFILDDNLPKIPEFAEKNIYTEGIKKDDLQILIDNGNWRGEYPLKQILSNLISHEYVKKGFLSIRGFINPQICLDEIKENSKPDVIIYDWEYGFPHKDSREWLLQILELTDAFVFVYSNVRQIIPQDLQKVEFDKYANRFQLFSKGNTDNSVFSSEDFIYQYILSLINKNNIIKIQGKDVNFTSNGYLAKPTDILYLESILGRESLLHQIAEFDNDISEKNVENIIEKLNGELFFERNGGFLIAKDQELYIDTFKPKETISYIEVLKEFGLKKLKEVLEIGFVKV